MNKFEALGIAPKLGQKLTENNIKDPTPIQTEAIPIVLSGRDVMNIYKKEVDRKRSITRKAEFVNTQLVFVMEALRQLYQEDHFTTLLKAEQIETLPKPIAEILTNRAERHV